MQNNIKIAGFQKNSFIDYPGKIAAVIFLGGCNFVCHYCHNNNILGQGSNVQDFVEVVNELREQVGFLDGVVISGGEPTLHPQLTEIAEELKKLGFLVKLDTNGTNSRILKELVEKKLVDYVAMDIKASLEKYAEIIGTQTDINEVKTSIEYLKEQKHADYMFRTTLSPMLSLESIRGIGELIKGAKCFQLQQFVPNDFSNSHSIVHLPYSAADAKKFEAELKKYCDNVILRGF